jgi:secreted trypsin-like serine protease
MPDTRSLVRDCIEQAALADDRDFVRRLNEAYVASGGAGAPARGRSRSVSVAQVSNPGLDPRYAANARALALADDGGSRVLDGEPVPRGMFLDCVAVGSGTKWACTGTLLAPRVVVTAGHCARFATRVFIGGEVPPEGADPAAYGVVYTATPKVHHQYTPGTEENDLTVLVLDTPANVPPRRIAPSDLIDAAPFGRVVGFGNTDPEGTSGYGVKRWVDVPIASAACSGSVDGKQDSQAYGCFSAREIVAGKPLLGKDSCTGDSGGPFYLRAADNTWYVAGATSRATNKAANNCGDGGIYVRLDAYRDWIEAETGVTLP